MRKVLPFGVAVVALVGVLNTGLFQAAADEKPKYTISEVMVKAHKQGLLKKVTSGQASDAEKKQLCELYAALAATPCPKGDAASWKKMTGAIVVACEKVAKGGGAADQAALAKAVNCGACHKAHR
ncbi:MAG: hypothetical protein ACK4RK_19165 [Gemmataceae bacterium]